MNALCHAHTVPGTAVFPRAQQKSVKSGAGISDHSPGALLPTGAFFQGLGGFTYHMAQFHIATCARLASRLQHLQASAP
jgi:hypothetical protein